MLQARHYKWLPNALTSSRGVLAVGVFLAALNNEWVLAFWLFLVALLTDFLDGLAAKKLNAYSKFGHKLDSGADGLLAAGGVAGLSAAGVLPWLVTFFVLIFGASMGARHYIPGWAEKTTVAIELGAKTCLFLTWIGITWFFATLAYGWSWLYVLLTVLVLLVAASLKRHRLRAWLHKS